MLDRLEQMEQRYNDMQAQFALPEVLNDHEKSHQKIAKALREIESPVEKYRELKQVRQGLAEARAMLAESDADLRAMAQEEIAALEPREQALEEELKVMLLPKDPNDEKNVILEIRAGTGGDEASLFAAEIFRMYTRFAEQKRWKVEVMSHLGVRHRRIQGSHRHHRGRARLLAAQVGVGRPPRAARAGNRAAGPRPHLRHHRRRAARSRRGRHQDRSQGHPH